MRFKKQRNFRVQLIEKSYKDLISLYWKHNVILLVNFEASFLYEEGLQNTL